jgi:hypothetical protein
VTRSVGWFQYSVTSRPPPVRCASSMPSSGESVAKCCGHGGYISTGAVRD